MDDKTGERADLVNARLTVAVVGVPGESVPGMRVAIKALLSEWGEVKVTASISDYRPPVTMADIRARKG